MTKIASHSSIVACFAECDPTHKVEQTRAMAVRFRAGELLFDPDEMGTFQPDQPGRPERPQLVAPRHLPRRRLNDTAGRAALIHAVAHIEFNAINLALDAVLRFPHMPSDYYADWLRVADEEAYHFSLMRERLRALGYDYGDFPAHDGLWAMARQTAGDLLERMALVPRVLEARGLDVTPMLVQGPTVELLLNEADKLGIDMIIMGSHGHGALYNALVGTVSEGVLHKAKCPVLIVPSDASAKE